MNTCVFNSSIIKEEAQFSESAFGIPPIGLFYTHERLTLRLDAKHGFGYGTDKQRIKDFIKETGYSEIMFKRYKAEFELDDICNYSRTVQAIKVKDQPEPDEELPEPIIDDEDYCDED